MNSDPQKALNEVKSWKKRQDRDNGFSKNKHRDGSDVLENNYDAIVVALEAVTQKAEHAPWTDTWYTFDGVDEDGLNEFIGNLPWEVFIKGGKDKRNNFNVFLHDDENQTIGAINCRSKNAYRVCLEKLREECDE